MRIFKQLTIADQQATKGYSTKGRWWSRRWRGRGRAWGYFMWGLRRILCIRWVLDLLWHMWNLVPRQVREDHTCKSGAHQAVQMPVLQQQQKKPDVKYIVSHSPCPTPTMLLIMACFCSAFMLFISAPCACLTRF